jgi:predicted nucleic acid-binding protein
MSGIVIDASITAAWFFPDEITTDRLALLEAAERESSHAPSHWPLEVANSLFSATTPTTNLLIGRSLSTNACRRADCT